MKALIVGHGSIGKRRARDLAALEVEVVTADPLADADESDPLAAIRKHAPGNLVLVCSPSSEHVWQTIQAIDAGALAVLVEKPPAYSAGEWALAVNLAAKRSVPMAVAFNYRYHSDIEYLRAQKTDIETLVISAADYVIGWPSFGPNSYVLDARYGGTLMTSSVHAVDVAIHLKGPGRLVSSGMVRGPGFMRNTVSGVLLEIEHNAGRTIISNNWFGPPHSIIAGMDMLHAPPDDMHKRMLAAFVNYAETGVAGLLCTAEQAIPVMQILDEARA